MRHLTRRQLAHLPHRHQCQHSSVMEDTSAVTEVEDSAEAVEDVGGLGIHPLPLTMAHQKPYSTYPIISSKLTEKVSLVLSPNIY
jgi:hypothetical protein